LGSLRKVGKSIARGTCVTMARDRLPQNPTQRCAVTTDSSASSVDLNAFRYGSRTLRRAERSLHCSPFRPALFVAMQAGSVPLMAAVGKVGVERGYSLRPLPELGAESYQ